MEWQQHLEELRFRLLRSLALITLLFTGGLALSDYIFAFLLRPYRTAFEAGLNLNYSYMGESIVLTMQCSLFTALFIAVPYILFELLGYIRPALSVRIQKTILPLYISGILLFYAGAAFAFFLLLPMSIGMIIRFSRDSISSFISSTNYISFLFTFCAGTGFLFEMPVVLSILAASGIITPAILMKKRKYIIVLIWIAAAILTPPDILSQALVAIPLMLLFEISVLIVYLIAGRNGRGKRADAGKIRKTLSAKKTRKKTSGPKKAVIARKSNKVKQ